MNPLLQSLLPYLTWAVLGLVFIGIILLILLVVVLVRSIRAASRARQASKVAVQRKSASNRWERLKLFWEKIKIKSLQAKEKYTIGPKDEIAASFKRTTDILNEYIDGKESQYQLPWFMVIGCEESGKTSLLAGSELELPIGSPQYEGFPETAKINWTFFDGAVIADIKGEITLQANDVASDERQWDYILNLFKYYRPKRPLDGIVLTIPADELIGQEQRTKEEILQRAKVLYAKLWKLQNTLGMRVPVYVLITKSDKIPGFASLVSQIPPENRHEMFGWSSPYELKAGFSEEWVNEIFRSIQSGLTRLRASIFTREVEEENRSGNALVPIGFNALRSSLGLYLNQLFKDSSYHDSFFLRGVYFCGYDDADEGSKFRPSSPVSSAPLVEQQSSSLSSVFGKSKQFVFVRDLFEKKIFHEYSLGEPIPRMLVSTHRVLNLAKIICFGLAVVWAIGLYHDYKGFKNRNQSIMPAMKLIKDSIQGVNEMGGISDNPKVTEYLKAQSGEILTQFTSIQVVNTFSVFIPPSWFSVLDEKIQRSFTVGYDRIILPSLSIALLQKLQDITSKDKVLDVSIDRSKSYANPLTLPSFMSLEQYVKELYKLEKVVEAYNNLDKTQSIADLGMLIKYLYNKALPSNFYTNTRYYQDALGRTSEIKIDVVDFKNFAIDKLISLYRTFFNDAFNIETSLQALVQLQQALDNLAQYTSYKKMDDHDLRMITEKAIAFADLASSSDMTWVGKQLFDPGARYNDLMDHVTNSKMLGLDIASELGRAADIAFSQFRVNLAERKSLLTGTLFTVKNGQLFSDPSSGLIQFIDSSTAFLNEPFMTRANRQEIVFKIPPGKMLFWEEVTLQKSSKTIDEFKDFQIQRLPKFTPNLQVIFKEIGRNSTRQKVANFVAQAQTFHNEPIGFSSFGMREMLIAQVQNIAVTSPAFAAILGVFNDGGFVLQNSKLRELLVKQNYDILTRIDNLLVSDNLYSANEERLEWWAGEPYVAFRLFGVRDSNDMKEYLAAQRLSITFLAKEMAAPILNLLSYGFLENVPIDLPLVTKWSRILAVIEDYAKKTPGNSMKVLETFLLDDLNKISLENCLERIGDFDRYPNSSDYFLDIRNHFFSLVEKRCEAIGLKDAIVKYNEAAAFFNANLAGRFPFTQSNQTSCAPEAEAEDVATFYQVFDSILPMQREMLKFGSRHRGIDASVAVFIKEIERIRPLLLLSLDTGDTKPLTRINLEAVFRTDREREIGGENIIDWSMQVGGGQLSMREGIAKAEWRVGVPIDIMIKWAANGETAPLSDPRVTHLNVSGSNAVFSYTGRWALVRLLREHAMAESVYDTKMAPEAQLLEFRIPTVFNSNCYRGKSVLPIERTSSPVRLYMRLALQVPGKELPVTFDRNGKPEKTPPAPKTLRILSVPQFPYKAPLYYKRGD